MQLVSGITEVNMFINKDMSLVEMAKDHNGRQIELIRDNSQPKWPYSVKVYDVDSGIMVSTQCFSTIGYAMDAFKRELE